MTYFRYEIFAYGQFDEEGVILSLIGGSGVVLVVERSSSGSFDEVIGTVGTDDFGFVLGIALGIVE